MTDKKISEYICKWIFNQTSIKIHDSDDIFLIGKLDSLLFAELIAAVEFQFGVYVDFTEIQDWEQIKTPVGLSGIIAT
jgi:acyl carrier protein